MKFKEVEKMLIENGRFTIPRHNKDVNVKTLISILKQAGIKNKE